MKEKEITPAQEALNILKDSLKDFFVLQEDNLWGKKGEVVKHIKDFGTSSKPVSEWKGSDAASHPLVAAHLEYLKKDRKCIIPLFEHLQNGGEIKLTELSFLFKS